MFSFRKKHWFEDHENCRRVRSAILARKKLKRLKVPPIIPIVSGSHRFYDRSLERVLERTQEIEMDMDDEE